MTGIDVSTRFPAHRHRHPAARRPHRGRRAGRSRPTANASPSSWRRSTSARTRRRAGSGWPDPTATRRRSRPARTTARPWSPDGRWLAFASRRGEKEHESTLHVLPVAGPGEVRTVVARCPTASATWRGRPTAAGSAFTSRTRDARYEAKDERWQAPRKIETFFTRLDDEGWIFDRPQHVYVVAADGTGAAAQPDARPVPARRRRLAGRLVGRRHRRRPRHDSWDRDLCERPLRRPARRRRSAPLTKQTGRLRPPVGVARRHDGRVPRRRRLRRRTRRTPRSASSPLDGRRAPLDLRAASTARSRPTAGVRSPVWLDDDTLLATAEDRGETHLYRLHVDGSADPERAHRRAGHACTTFDAAGGRDRAWPSRPSSTPARSSTRDGPVTARRRASFLGWERFAVPTTDGTDEIDAWIMRPDGFEPRRKYPVLLNVHGGPFTQYGETFFDEAQMQAAAGFVVADVQPAWRQRPRHGVGPGDHRARSTRSRPGTRLGHRSTSTTSSPCSTRALARYAFCDRDRVGHARRQLRRLHGHVAGRHATATGSGRSAASGRSTTCSPRSGRATSARSSASSTAPSTSTTPRVRPRCRRSATCATSTCRC